MSDVKPRYIDYVVALTRHFDAPDSGGAAFMGQHQLDALREVHPELFERLWESDLMPFADNHAHPELELWIINHWENT
jgi:hypothetical protein